MPHLGEIGDHFAVGVRLVAFFVPVFVEALFEVVAGKFVIVFTLLDDGSVAGKNVVGIDPLLVEFFFIPGFVLVEFIAGKFVGISVFIQFAGGSKGRRCHCRGGDWPGFADHFVRGPF